MCVCDRQKEGDTIFSLQSSYDNPDVALNCGMMLRECVRHEPLAKIVLHSEEFYKLFSYVEVSTFDIASDAFATFKDLLTRHKILCAQFLEKNYDKVCPFCVCVCVCTFA